MINITDLPKATFTDVRPNISDKENTAVISLLSSADKYFHGMFKEDLETRGMKTLCQAVMALLRE